jgi:hypothetical protein
VFGSEEDLHHENGRTDYYGTVGDVEIGPNIRSDVELKKVDYVAGKNAIPKIPERTTEDQGQSKGCAVESLSMSPQES